MARIEDDDDPRRTGAQTRRRSRSTPPSTSKAPAFPWQEEANVYIAGHRLGFPNTESWLTFWDLNKVDVGDEVFVTDADGTKYTYKVFKEFTVGPSDVSVTSPSRARTS